MKNDSVRFMVLGGLIGIGLAAGGHQLSRYLHAHTLLSRRRQLARHIALLELHLALAQRA